MRYFENVASLTWLAPVVVFIAWRHGWRIPRFWAGLALVFGALALGPFVHVARHEHARARSLGVPAIRARSSGSRARRAGSASSLMLVVADSVRRGADVACPAMAAPPPALLLATGALLIFELLPAPRSRCIRRRFHASTTTSPRHLVTCACWSFRSASVMAPRASATSPRARSSIRPPTASG